MHQESDPIPAALVQNIGSIPVKSMDNRREVLKKLNV
jgi:hypothetical protein